MFELKTLLQSTKSLKSKKMAGFNLLALVISTLLLAVAVLSGASVLQQFSDLNLLVNRKSVVLDLELQLLQAMQNPQICSCNLNPNLRTDAPNFQRFHVNTTLTGGTLDVQRVRLGCANSSPVLVEPDLNLGHGLFVEDVVFTNLRPTGHPNEYEGLWRISIRTPAGAPPVPQIEAHQYITLDPTTVASNPEQALVQACVGDTPQTGLINNCPPGFTMIGNPNQYNTYCIHTTSQTPAQFLQAKYNCAQIRPEGFGPAHLCTRNEWFGGCSSAALSATFGMQWEWFPDNDESVGGVLRSTGNCTSSTFHGLDQARNYRCCFK